MNKFQAVNNGNTYEIYPLRGYIALIIYLILFLLIAFVPILFLGSDVFGVTEILKIVFYSFIISFILFFPLGVIFYKYCYHFDWKEKKIYKKLFFYKKLKMDAANVEIAKNSFLIVDKTDRFSKPINLVFFEIKRGNTSENTKEFLALITKKWLNEIPEKKEEKILRFGNLQYFKSKNNIEFEFIKSNKINKVFFIGFSLAFVYQMYYLLSKDSSDVGFLNFISGIPAFVFLIIISTRTIFNLKDKMIYTKFLWVIPYEKMNLMMFHNFEITKHYTNGMFTGTSLNMLFSKKNNPNKYRNLTIVAATKKTKPFEDIMNEIRFLLSKTS